MKKAMALLVLSTFIISGCALMNKKQVSTTSGLLEPQSIAKFSDLPVPAGFKLLAPNSYSFESAGVRVAVLKYRGKTTPEQVINFYKEQMPMYSWNLLNIVEYGERMLNFDTDSETCVIRIIPAGSSVTITISLGPKPQIPKKPAKGSKPVK
jgi:hypothetical protein